LLLESPVLSDIVTFVSATNIAIVKATTTIDIFCITGGSQESDFKLEDSSLITALLSNPQNKSVAIDVAQQIQKFYFTDVSNSAAVFSNATNVSYNFLFCSYSTKFSVREKLTAKVHDNRILRGISKLREA
jgi:hypothetical protein